MRVTVLVIASDPVLAQVFREAGSASDCVVIAAPDAAHGVAAARTEQPGVIVVGPLVGAANPNLCGALRGLEACAHASLIAVAPEAGASDRVPPGADDLLSWPVDPAAARRALRRALVLNAVRDAHRDAARELARIQSERDGMLDQVIASLERMIELSIPGARLRAERSLERARRLAERFEIPAPMRRELEIAARLCELGRIATATPVALHAPASPEHWQYTQATRVVLGRIQGLAEVGDLVASLYENWDGTGHPDHRLQGQIPLRSRILRALIDFESMRDRGVTEALERLMDQAGTRYDPMVVTQLAELITNDSRAVGSPARALLPVDALEPGMKLAEDLYSSSGLKLLSRDTVLTATALDAILRRHRAEPILHSAAVHRAA